MASTAQGPAAGKVELLEESPIVLLLTRVAIHSLPLRVPGLAGLHKHLLTQARNSRVENTQILALMGSHAHSSSLTPDYYMEEQIEKLLLRR